MAILPRPDAGCAVFFDFDGTLVDLAARPDLVHVPQALPHQLARLAAQLDGALALVSGRPVAQIDGFLQPVVLPVAGVHGAERRAHDGTTSRLQLPGLDVVADRLQAWCDRHPELLLERKPAAIALHYRGADELEEQCVAAMTQAARELPEMSLMHGKKVLELKPKAANKGSALRAFLAEPPFADRKPFFFGDDVTDEAGFEAVQQLGGVAVKVGEGESLASYRLAGPAAVRQWLQAQLDG
ncbi:trehalose-phosphatase [Piscinibacter sakaiensis]|uniref:trehalose-phosphatase n=1 Tax=Piscinibacter sakaiensis TaxID=1547922 RepID=UPI003AADFE6E